MSKKKVKVAIIGTNGLPANYGGFETLTNYLTLYLKEDFDFQVYCSNTSNSKKLQNYNGARLIYIPLKANGWQSVPYDIITIIHAWFTSNILLILGNSGALIFPFKYFSGKKIILNIGGIDWMRNKWNYFSRKFIYFSEWLAVKYADTVITDNQIIHDHYKSVYNRENLIIPYGGDHVFKPDISIELQKKYTFLKERDYSISISRAQEDNLIHLVLEAFSKMPDKTLVLISNWQASSYGIALKKKFKDFKNLFLLDAIYDLKELNVLRGYATSYIHSHSFCGTAPSLVEAMHLGLPIISYNSPTNLASTGKKAIYFNNVNSLIEIIQKLNNDTLAANKKYMTEIAKSKYTWKKVTTAYKNVLIS